MELGCIFVDGSYMLAALQQARIDHPELAGHKLNIDKLSGHIMNSFGKNFPSSLRVIYYFKKGDSRLTSDLTIPSKHNIKGHWIINECGESVKGAKTIPQEQLERLDEEYQDIFPRAEKGVDMELACDALLLAANGHVRSFVFMFNDRDYIPLVKAIHRLGGNTYLVGLDEQRKIQKNLLTLIDRYLTLEGQLRDIFDVK